MKCLFRSSDIASDILYSDGIFHGELEGLTLDSSRIHQHTRIRIQTREGQEDVIVHNMDLPNRPIVLQNRHRLLLHRYHHAVFPANPDL